MVDEQAVRRLELLLRNNRHTKAARYLADAYVSSRLTLPQPGEPLVARLPSGRAISFTNSRGLASLAETIERLYHGSVLQSLPRLLASLQDELAIQARREDIPWLSSTSPYQRLKQLTDHPDESETRTTILQSWLEYQRRHPGTVTPQEWSAAFVRRLGFTTSFYAAVERLNSVHLDGLLAEVLAVIHSPQPVLHYSQNPACLILQRAQVIPGSQLVSTAKKVIASLRRASAVIIQVALANGQGLGRVLDSVLREGSVRGAQPHQVVETLKIVGQANNLRELTQAVKERSGRHVVSPSPIRPIDTTSDWRVLTETLGSLDPGVPNEVMRSLLKAALQRATLKRKYGLPDGEYWVMCPDPVLKSVLLHCPTDSCKRSLCQHLSLRAPIALA